MLLDFNKPKKIMSEEERADTYSSDCSVPGTYVPNMSSDDMKKWKGKYIKGKYERVEIRKSISGTQLVVVVYKEVRKEECQSYSGNIYNKLIHKNVHISANGKILLTFDEYSELLQVIEEARTVLRNSSTDMTAISLIESEVGNDLINYISALPKALTSAISGLEIDVDVFAHKIPNREGYSYAVKNKYSQVFSNIDGEFYIEVSPSSRDEEYYEEFRFNTIEDAILGYYTIKEQE